MADTGLTSGSSDGWFSVLWERTWWLFAILLCGGFIALALANPFLLVRLLALLFLLVGSGSVIYVVRGVLLARRSERWYPVEGRVVRSEVSTEQVTSGVGSRRDSFTNYYPEIEYEYSYRGTTYRSRRILFVNVNWARSDAEDLVGRHAVGATPTVYLDPSHPDSAVLLPGLGKRRGEYLRTLIIGSGFLVIGTVGWFLVSLLRR